MRKLTWEQWYGKYMKLYAKPFVTYDGMVVLWGSPRKGAKKQVVRPSRAEISKYRSNTEVTAMLRRHYKAGDSPDDAWAMML